MKRKWTMVVLLAACLFVWGGFSAAKADSSAWYSPLAAGGTHSLALDEQGRLYTWGSNCFGVLGNGRQTRMNFDAIHVINNQDAYTPTRLQLSPAKRFVHVAAGDIHSLALTNDGMLYAWGCNRYGQLGLTAQETQARPVPVMADVAYVSAYSDTTVIVKKDGTVWLCGSYAPGMLAQPPAAYGDLIDASLQIASGAVMAVASPYCLFYIDTAGQLWGIGQRSGLGIGEPSSRAYTAEPVRILTDIVDVALDGRDGGCAVDRQGTMYAWGNGIATPLYVTGDAARVFSEHLVLKRDGTLWERGNTKIGWNYYSEDGSSYGASYFYDNGRSADAWILVMGGARYAASFQQFLAMDEEGALYGWGCNIFGMAGTPKRTVIKHHLYSDDHVGDIYDCYVDTVQDASAPVKLSPLAKAKQSAKISIGSTPPTPVALSPAWTAYEATLNQRMATRTGPGTKFTEDHGTQSKDTQIVVYAQETGGSTTWALVEYRRKDGKLVRTYTGTKRIDADFSAIPYTTREPLAATVTKTVTAYYGPGKAYKDVKQPVEAGTSVKVYGSEMGYALIEYAVEGAWMRAWVPMEVLTLR